MAYVVCTVEEGLRPSEVTVGVEDVDGRMQYLRVEKDYVKKVGGVDCLPIGVIWDESDGRNSIRIELPHEADSGVNRMWVSQAIIRGAEQGRGAARRDLIGPRDKGGTG